jgi:hypothetical protein
MIRANVCPSSRAIDRIFYSLWFSAPKLLSGFGQDSRCADCVYDIEGACVCGWCVCVGVCECLCRCVGVCVSFWLECECVCVGVCVWVCVWVCVFVGRCVCVCERERERDL